MTNARASWNVISTQSVYLYNCPLFEATRAEYPLSEKNSLDLDLYLDLLAPLRS